MGLADGHLLLTLSKPPLKRLASGAATGEFGDLKVGLGSVIMGNLDWSSAPLPVLFVPKLLDFVGYW